MLWGSNFWLSHKKEKSPLTQGLNYRSACDKYKLINNLKTTSSAIVYITLERRVSLKKHKHATSNNSVRLYIID